MIKENVIICACIKNIDKFLNTSLDLCIKTGELFENYKIIIYENNSTDKTKEILNKYNQHPNMKIISEYIPYDIIKKNSKCWAYTRITGSNHPCRMEQISNGKNKIIDEFLNENKYDNYNYVIFIDIDTNYWDLNGIVNSFERKDEWDVIFANGIKEEGYYYDLYAFKDNSSIPFLFGCEILGEYSFNFDNYKNFKIPQDKNEFIPVISAFGGIGIYKKELFKENRNLRYTTVITNDIINFYTNILINNNIDENLMKIIESPCVKFPGGKETFYLKNGETKKIYWKNNCGYDNIVICEHLSINVFLFLIGKRLMINPKMVYIWTH